MNKLLIVIVDEDENYLSPLELRFANELGSMAEIITITEKGYLEQYFSVPRKIDILIINKTLYNDSFIRHDIENTFILLEEDACSEDNEVYKYTSVKDIYDKIISHVSLDEKLANEKRHTQVIMLYSPIGGAGTTSLSIAAAGAAASKNKSVLYISMENIQSLSCFIGTERYAQMALQKAIINKDFSIAEKVKSEALTANNISYLPPMQQATAVLGIKDEHYVYMLEKLKAENLYDYIIIDAASEINTEKCMMMKNSERVIVVTRQEKIAARKTDILLENIDCSDLNKFIFVCNMYSPERDNNLTNSTMKNNCIVKLYIERYNEAEKLMSSESFRNLVYGIM